MLVITRNQLQPTGALRDQVQRLCGLHCPFSPLASHTRGFRCCEKGVVACMVKMIDWGDGEYKMLRGTGQLWITQSVNRSINPSQREGVRTASWASDLKAGRHAKPSGRSQCRGRSRRTTKAEKP